MLSTFVRSKYSSASSSFIADGWARYSDEQTRLDKVLRKGSKFESLSGSIRIWNMKNSEFRFQTRELCEFSERNLKDSSLVILNLCEIQSSMV